MPCSVPVLVAPVIIANEVVGNQIVYEVVHVKVLLNCLILLVRCQTGFGNAKHFFEVGIYTVDDHVTVMLETVIVICIAAEVGVEGLVAYYPFENDASDSSGKGLHGTVVGDPTFVEGPAGYGMALDFDGDGDYVDCGNSTLFDVTEQITVAAWVPTLQVSNIAALD
jgi:hypothetical protein